MRLGQLCNHDMSGLKRYWNHIHSEYGVHVTSGIPL